MTTESTQAKYHRWQQRAYVIGAVVVVVAALLGGVFSK